MLGKNFLTVNGTPIPNPVDFDISLDEIENTRTSESGVDMVSVVRLDKHTFSGSWNLSSYWKNIFKGFAELPEVTLTFDGDEYTCRARGFSAKLVENSARAYQTNGLWEVSLDFIEE